SLRLQGLTLTQAETLIANRLSRILRRPFISFFDKAIAFPNLKRQKINSDTYPG
ncbi:MAG: hypothetical protein F6K09_08595, partial [Merismopedia sp. SIO2A8]|nr:hypothetical protein [Merismopedia sp. SIO2A8]